jgi:hypothetical protein
MEKEVPENILEKIRKLLRLKESAIKIGSEGEAHAAAEAVNRLLTSYNLSLMDVTPEEQKNMISVGASEKITYQDTYGVWKRDLLRIICEYNFCRILLYRGTTYMVVVGTRENAEVVISLYNYLRSVFRRLSVERYTEYVATYGEYYRTKEFKRNYIKSYLLGCCFGLRKQFESIRKTAEETGLMLYHRHLIDDYFQSIGTTTHKSKNRNNVNAAAYCSGYDDGSKINLNKQIDGK